MALFSNVRQPQSSNLVEFRAGKMFTRGGGETGAPLMVHPDKRKGLVYIYQSDDGLMHFCWKDRTTSNLEDDLIVFPDDVEFVRVDQCTTGRVFLLKFKNSPRKLFYWMQEPKTDKDEEHCRKVNELLNSPPVPGSGRGGRGGGQEGMDQFAMMNQLLGLGGSGAGAEDRMDLQNALAGMDHQQLMQLLNLMGGGSGGLGLNDAMPMTPSISSSNRRSTPPSAAAAQPTRPPAVAAVNPAAPSMGAETAVVGDLDSARAAGVGPGRSNVPPNPPASAVQLSDLRNILANLSTGVSGSGGSGGPPHVDAAVDLESVLSANNVEASVRRPENGARLLAHLPEEDAIEKSNDELIHTIRSPQYRQAVDMFGTALQTGQLAPLMSQFGLPDNAIEACQRGDIQSMAEILEREGTSTGASASGTDKEKKDKKEKKDSKGSDKKDKKDDQEGMDLD